MINNFLSNIFSLKNVPGKSEMEKWVFISCIFSLALVLWRIIFTGQTVFLFLAWNLFLAVVPYFISSRLRNSPKLIHNKWKFTAIFIAWIVFIPNSFYILTDLFHVDALNSNRPSWFDLTMILSFAWNGLLLGILSVRQMEKIVTVVFRLKNRFLFLYPIMWLNALGIYIGRFLRFNSWDVITNPFHLLADIGEMLVNPVDHIYVWGMICCFSVLMTIMYLSVSHRVIALPGRRL